MSKEPVASVGSAVDTFKREQEKLPELAPNQPIYYLVRSAEKGESYKVVPAVYVGEFKAFKRTGSEQRALLAMQPVHQPGMFVRAAQEAEARRANHDIIPGQPQIVLDKHDNHMLEQATSARLEDTRRMNPSRGDLTAGLAQTADQAEMYARAGRMLVGPKSPVEAMQSAVLDLRSGKMTPAAYAVVADLARLSIQGSLPKELKGVVPVGTQEGWPYAVEALRVIETALDEMNKGIDTYLAGLEVKRVALFEEQRVAANSTTKTFPLEKQMELEAVLYAQKGIRENRENTTRELRGGRDNIARTLGKLLTAITWYQESNSGKQQ